MPRHRVCHALALAFSLMVVAPAVAIMADRTPPFEYVNIYPKQETVRPGEVATNVFVVRKSRVDACEGEFDRYFTDALGFRTFLGTHRARYREGLEERGVPSFESDWIVPRDAANGPGLYESFPRFWCNNAQRLAPINVTPIRVKVVIAS